MSGVHFLGGSSLSSLRLFAHPPLTAGPTPTCLSERSPSAARRRRLGLGTMLGTARPFAATKSVASHPRPKLELLRERESAPKHLQERHGLRGQAEKIAQTTVLRLKFRDSFSKVALWATFTRAVVGRQIQLLSGLGMVGTTATRRIPVRATNRGVCRDIMMGTPQVAGCPSVSCPSRAFAGDG